MNLLQKKKALFLTLLSDVKGFVRTVTGAAPINLYDIVDVDSLISLRISGAEGGVGDKTDNLLNPELLNDVSTDGITAKIDQDEIIINGTETFTRNTAKQISTYLPLTEAGYYTFEVVKSDGIISSGDVRLYIYMRGGSLKNTVVMPLGNERFVKAVKLEQSDVDKGVYLSLYFMNNVTYIYDDFKVNLRIVKGQYNANTLPPYVPYGYKLPVSISGNVTDYYLDKQLYADDVFTYPDILQLEVPTCTIDINTSVKPSNVEAVYYSTQKGN